MTDNINDQDSKSTAIRAISRELRQQFKTEADYKTCALAITAPFGGGDPRYKSFAAEHQDAILDGLKGALSVETDRAKDAPPPDNDGSQQPNLKGRNLEDICAEWVWVVGLERFVRLSDSVMWSAKQFDSRFNSLLPSKPSVSAAIFKTANQVRRYDRAVYRPGRPMNISPCFNLWRPSPVVAKQAETPEELEAVRVWNAHFEYLFPDKTDRDHVLNWLAWVYQNQHKKPKHALLIVGKNTGTGKSLIARIFEQLIGVENTQRPKNSSLKGDFNAWAQKCKLVLIEELMQIGKREVANELRDLITEPTIEVNIKKISAQLVENYMALFGITNHPDALPADDTERRWLVVSTPAERRDWDYYTPLYALVDPPNSVGLAAIAWELKTRKLGKYSGTDTAPDTDARQEMIAATAATRPYKQWLLEQDFSEWKLINIQIDLLGLTVPAYVSNSSEYKNRQTAAATEFLRDTLGGKSLKGKDGKPYTFGNAGGGGLDGGDRKGGLWAVNGCYVEFAGLQPGAIVKAYRESKPQPIADQLAARRTAKAAAGDAARVFNALDRGAEVWIDGADHIEIKD